MKKSRAIFLHLISLNLAEALFLKTSAVTKYLIEMLLLDQEGSKSPQRRAENLSSLPQA